MAIRRKKPVAPVLELTPLVDVVFLLLTFYMLTSSFVREEGVPLELPNAEASVSKPPKTLTVSLIEDDKVELDSEIIPISELTSVVKQKMTDDTVVVIRAGKDGDVQSLLSVIDRLKEADVSSVTLATNSGGEDVSAN